MTASQTMNLRPSFVLACVLILATTQVVEAGTCICSSMATWYSCPHGGACMSWCMSHGGVRYWGGPGKVADFIPFGVMLLLCLSMLMGKL